MPDSFIVSLLYIHTKMSNTDTNYIKKPNKQPFSSPYTMFV